MIPGCSKMPRVDGIAVKYQNGSETFGSNGPKSSQRDMRPNKTPTYSGFPQRTTDPSVYMKKRRVQRLSKGIFFNFQRYSAMVNLTATNLTSILNLNLNHI